MKISQKNLKTEAINFQNDVINFVENLINSKDFDIELKKYCNKEFMDRLNGSICELSCKGFPIGTLLQHCVKRKHGEKTCITIKFSFSDFSIGSRFNKSVHLRNVNSRKDNSFDFNEKIKNKICEIINYAYINFYDYYNSRYQANNKIHDILKGSKYHFNELTGYIFDDNDNIVASIQKDKQCNFNLSMSLTLDELEKKLINLLK